MKLPPVQTARRCETEITYPYELQCSICTFSVLVFLRLYTRLYVRKMRTIDCEKKNIKVFISFEELNQFNKIFRNSVFFCCPNLLAELVQMLNSVN